MTDHELSGADVPEFVRGPSLVNRRDLVVEWGHCDPAGIVFHPRFIEYFDWCCVLLIERAIGLTKAQLHEAFGFAGLPIVDLQAKFLAAVTYNDAIQIYSTVTGVQRSSLRYRHCLVKAGNVAVECEQTRVWCVSDPHVAGKLKSAPVPVQLLQALRI